MTQVAAIVPARGGSKGIPRKNIIEILGKPVIAYSIRHGLESRLIERVIVSTDDEMIAEVAEQYGAEVPFLRPPEFARDASPDIDVFRHALEWLRTHEGYEPELVVHLRPTGPVRVVADIDRAIEAIQAVPEADSLRSVSVARQSPFKMWREEGQFIRPVVELEDVPGAHSQPRQKLPLIYWQNGYVDVIRCRTILIANSMTGRNVLPFVIEHDLFELDYPDDIPVVTEALRKQAEGELDFGRGESQNRHPV